MPRTIEKDTKAADEKGRVTLGIRHANATFAQQENSDGSILLVPIVQLSIPKDQAWLFRNPTALESLKTGIKQAASGKFSEDPRKKNDLSWIKEIKD